MKLIILHQSFHPDVSGSAIRLTELAAGLSSAGHEVTVLTSQLPETPKKETLQGIEIHRLGKSRFNKNTLPGRILNYLSFLFSAFLKTLISDRKAVIYIGSDPPFLCVIGPILKILKGQKYVLHIADLYPDLAVELGYLKKSSWMHRLWTVTNRFAYSKAEKVITLGDDMKEKILAYLPSSNGSIHIIRNWEDPELARPIAKQDNWFAKEHGLTEKTVVLYSGNLGLVHDLLTVIEAAEMLRNEKEILFLFIGDGGQKIRLMELAAKKNLDNVRFLPFQPQKNIPYSLASGDIQIVSMKPGTEGLCVPGKFYTALAAGSAVLAMLPENTEVAQTIKRFECGILLSPGDPGKLSHSILELHKNKERLKKYGNNSRTCFEKYFQRARALREYESLFQSIIQN